MTLPTRISGDGEVGGLWIVYGDDWEAVWVVDVGTGQTTRVADRAG